jgi:hypothetical protein
MKHKYEIKIICHAYHEFEGDTPPTSREIRVEVFKSLHCGYFGGLKELTIISERHEDDSKP